MAKAFALLKDLAVTAAINKKAPQTFDFGSGTFPTPLQQEVAEAVQLLSIADEAGQTLYDEDAFAIYSEVGTVVTSDPGAGLPLVKIIFISEAKVSPDTNLLVCKVLMNAEGIVDLNTYDSLVVGTTVWQLGHIISSNGFIYEIKLQRVP